jgi:hypothetical protein
MIFAGFGSKRMLGAGSVLLRAFGRLAGLANPLGDYGQGVRLLALTGARRSEVFWHDVADSDSVNLGSNSEVLHATALSN